MGSSILSEVDNTSISGRGSQTRQRFPLSWLPVSRLLPPRSGLERSDFVPCSIASAAPLLTRSDLPRSDITHPGHHFRKGPRPCAIFTQPGPLAAIGGSTHAPAGGVPSLRQVAALVVPTA